MCVVSFHYGLVFLAHNKAKRLAVSQKEEKFRILQKEEKEIVTFYGLGPLEIIWSLSLFGYMCYNWYMLWKNAHENRGYYEE